ncbi:MAG: NAD(+) synthase [Clostridia bacterium]|nr:NAD(+) synthase [Clostridia bacterium]
MRHGFIKVCSATAEIKVADVGFNVNSIAKAAAEASQNGAQVIVFPELCICGYTCGDLFNQRVLLNSVLNGISALCEQLKKIDALVFVGAPLEKDGRLFNCAVAINCGKVIGVVPKTYLPTYGEFYEGRHFTPAEKENSYIEINGSRVIFGTKVIFEHEKEKLFTVAAELCEDLWVPCPPSAEHAVAGANIIVNLSCSDEIAGKAEYRRDMIKMHSARLLCGYVYSDAGNGESTTDMVFAGHDIICENGTVLAESKLFNNGLIYADIDADKLEGERRRCSDTFFACGGTSGYSTVKFSAAQPKGEPDRTFPKLPFVPDSDSDLSERTELILSLQAMGLVKRLKHTDARTAVIGISGGLDSALALLVTCRAFDILQKQRKDIIAITMPGFGTTGRTLSSSVKLINAVGATFKQVDITGSVLTHFKDIEHDPDVLDVTYENAQARMRTMILMNTANKTGGLVIGTGDLSELALGWATYNGDHMSMYAVNSSVPKTLVQHLIRHEAEILGGSAQEVLNAILDTDISPELLPPDKSGKIAQKTEDIVGPYMLHDFFLYYAVRWGFAPGKVRYLALKTFKEDFSEEEIDKWMKNFYKRFFAQQFKRSCIPDGVKVGTVTLSPRGDWRMPSDAMPAEWLNDIKNG